MPGVETLSAAAEPCPRCGMVLPPHALHDVTACNVVLGSYERSRDEIAAAKEQLLARLAADRDRPQQIISRDAPTLSSTWFETLLAIGLGEKVTIETAGGDAKIGILQHLDPLLVTLRDPIGGRHRWHIALASITCVTEITKKETT